MDRLSAEMLHMVCSYLSSSDICSLRLVNRTFAQLGECYLIPDLRFYLHAQELQRLRGIASHEGISKHVKSLTYSCDLLDAQDRQHLVAFAWSYAATHCAGRVRDLYDGTELKKFVMDLFRAYEADVQAQEDIIRRRADIDTLRNVLPSFTNLQRIAVHASLISSDPLRDSTTSYTPQTQIQLKKKSKKLAIEQLGGHFMDHLHPLGCRHLQSVLAGLTDAHAASLQSFYAGSLSWRFFDTDTAEVLRLFKPLRNVQHFELVIEAGLDPHYSLRESVAQCRRVMGSHRGHPLREILRNMPRLKTLKISFAHSSSGDMISPCFAADLSDILAPGYCWEHLQELHLQGIDTTRHSLMETVQQHQSTLQKLSLEDIGLKGTSWHKLVPDVRQQTRLESFTLSGLMMGQSEDDSSLGLNSRPRAPMTVEQQTLECWSLPRAQDTYVDYSMLVLKESINDYCRLGGQQNHKECPLMRASMAITMAPPTTTTSNTMTTTTTRPNTAAAPRHPLDMPPIRHWIGREILV